MGQLMAVLADRLTPDRPLTKSIFALPGALGPKAASIPLRFAGALHALKLRGNQRLADAYPPNTASDDELWKAVSETLDHEAGFIERFIQNPPQTNEVRRAICMITAASWLYERHPLPLVVSELGASAGLNLMFDRFALKAGETLLGSMNPIVTLTPDWTGTPPTPAPIQISERHGVDLQPVDASDPDQKLRLLAYLWPDQPDRLKRTEAVLANLQAQVDAGDAADWLADRTMLHDGHVHLIYHTIAWQYFPEATQKRATGIIESAGDRATENAPLAWLSMEWDGGKGAAMSLRLWPGNRHITLGRIDFHGRWVEWVPSET